MQIPNQPLADRMRPVKLDDFLGQEHLVSKGAVVRKMIESGNVMSFILWGPPGVGKTTLARIIANQLKRPFFNLSAVHSGVKEVRETIEKAKKQMISSSPGYSWIPDPNWIKPNPGKFLGLISTIKDVKVDAGKSKKFPLEVTIPEGQDNYGQKWEAIIMAEPEEGSAGFVRSKIETQEK